MSIRIVSLLLLMNWHAGLLSAGDVTGVVTEAGTGTPIPSAIVRVQAGTRGTVCNDDGVYRLALEDGDYVLVASSIGYSPDTVRVRIIGQAHIDFALSESAIIFPEIVVSGEDPAYEIIRQAIVYKHRWIDRLHSYQLSAFTRQVLRRDTNIASITEAFTTGYWRQGDTLREVTAQKRQTENIKAEFNFASVGRILNFQEEEIRFVRHSFVGPIADDAFDHYAYKLLRTRTSHEGDLYEIELIPLSETVPRFRGTISIAGGSYALVGVDVQPNEAFLLPFVRDKTIRYRQQFALFEGAYWLPADIRIDARFSVGVPGLSIPVIGFEQTSVIADYAINIPLPDSLFSRPRLSEDSTAARYDSTLWTGPGVLPLTAEEEGAYGSLDSTQTLDVQFRPGGIAMALGGGEGGGFDALRFLDVAYNRVEGAHLGVSVVLNDVAGRLDLRFGGVYGFSDKITKYHAGVTAYANERKTWGIGLDYGKLLTTIPEQGYFGTIFNSATSLIVRNDYSDYYLSTGFRAFLMYKPTDVLRTSVAYLNQEHESTGVNTDYGFFRSVQEFRENPPVLEGRFSSIQIEFGLGKEAVPLDLVSRDRLDLLLEFADPSLTGGSLSFARCQFVGTIGFATFGNRYFSPPGFRFRLAAGVSSDAPRQRVFALESSSSGVGPFGVMKAMRVKEFLGAWYFALNGEHNFRSLPFLWMDIPFLYRNNIEFIVHGGIAQSWNPDRIGTQGTTDGLYSEFGFGIGRIFELLRMDLTWRLSSPSVFHFTLSSSNLL